MSGLDWRAGCVIWTRARVSRQAIRRLDRSLAGRSLGTGGRPDRPGSRGGAAQARRKDAQAALGGEGEGTAAFHAAPSAGRGSGSVSSHLPRSKACDRRPQDTTAFCHRTIASANHSGRRAGSNRAPRRARSKPTAVNAPVGHSCGAPCSAVSRACPRVEAQARRPPQQGVVARRARTSASGSLKHPTT
jgi:hypothetical protein